MARATKAPRTQEVPPIPTNALVASAVRYTGKVTRLYNAGSTEWQRECYRHFHICGEARFAATFFGHALSRAVLTAVDEAGQVLTEGRIWELLAQLFNGKDGQAQMLKAIGTHLTIAGECYLIGRSAADDEERQISKDIWEIVSVLEVQVTGKKWSIDYGEGYEKIVLDDDDVVIRIWNPSPGKRIEADSPFRSLLPILQEIEVLTKRVFAQTTSGLTGAGIFAIPTGIDFPPPPELEGQNVSEMNQATQFMVYLADLFMSSIADQESPAARVPGIVQVPPEAIDKMKHLTFWTDLDAESLELRAEAIRRFAIGMDLPPEQVLGMSSNEGTGGGNSNGVSHWGAWQIEEATIKMHLEPMLNLIANALTVSYIRPLLSDGERQGQGCCRLLHRRPATPARPVEGVDGTGERGPAEGQDRGVGERVRPRDRHAGRRGTEDVLPPQDRRRLGHPGSGRCCPEHPVRRSTCPPRPRSARCPTRPGQTRRWRITPPGPRTPGEDAPLAPAAALVAASEGLVIRALEKAGNRLINANKRGKDRTEATVPGVRGPLHLRGERHRSGAARRRVGLGPAGARRHRGPRQGGPGARALLRRPVRPEGPPQPRTAGGVPVGAPVNSLALQTAVFAARRRSLQDQLTERLAGVIGATFGEGDIENLDKAIETMFREVYSSETDKPMRRGH